MGKGGSPAPQPTTVSQTTIPEYAKPYAERLLGKAEAASEAPYQTYGGQRLTTATPEQQAARSAITGLQAPEQFTTGTQLAGQAGLSALGAGQYQPGTFIAPLAQAEQIETGSFVAPGVAQQYMSPYMQQALDVQKAEAIRTAQQGQLAQNLAAARQGTYGGARQTLAMTERERNLQQELNRIQALGSQTGFEQAQRAFEAEQARRLQAGIATGQQGLQAQQISQQGLLDAQRMAEQSRQFGAGLGLQGAQAATQAGATLGQLGIAQQQQALDRLRAQEAAGALTQQEQQAALDLAYQDFIRQQQYPYAQLGFMSDILRGSSNLAATGSRAIYEAPQSTGAQLLGLASSLGGAYLAGRRFAEGGEVKGLSGIKGYAEGGEVSDVIEDFANVDKLTRDQIESMRAKKTRQDVPDFVLLAELDKKTEEIERFKASMARQGLPAPTVAEDIRAKAMQEARETAPAGLDAVSLPDDYYRSEEEVAQMAGGGIVAFANGGSTFDGFEMDAGVGEPTTSVPYEDFVGKMSLSELQEYYRSGKVPSRLKGERPTGLGSRGAPLIGTDKPAAPKQEAAPAPAPAPTRPPAPKKEGAGVSDKTVKKVEKAEDAYEKALREELDKTNLSKDDKLEALGFALMKFGARAFQARRGREAEAYGKGIEDAADSYVNTLKEAKKDRRSLTKAIAEYGLAKEGLNVRREQIAATERGAVETRRLRESMQDEALRQKYFGEYQKRYGMQPQFLKDGRPNPNWMSFETFLGRSGISSGGGMPPSSIATPGERPPIGSVITPRG